MTRLFLLDGTALAYRSHFALMRSSLTTPEGQPCGATYGFALTLNRILESESPDRIAIAFDPPGKTFRHERFAEYKATREKAPEEMVAQLDWMRELVRAQGIPLYEVRGFEADDVIGTLAVQAAEAGWEVRIVTGDKDFMQLVGPRVTLYAISIAAAGCSPPMSSRQAAFCAPGRGWPRRTCSSTSRLRIARASRGGYWPGAMAVRSPPACCAPKAAGGSISSRPIRRKNRGSIPTCWPRRRIAPPSWPG